MVVRRNVKTVKFFCFKRRFDELRANKISFNNNFSQQFAGISSSQSYYFRKILHNSS